MIAVFSWTKKKVLK